MTHGFLTVSSNLPLLFTNRYISMELNRLAVYLGSACGLAFFAASYAAWALWWTPPFKSRFTYLFWNHTYFIVKTQRKWKIPYMTCDPRVTYGVSKIYSYFSHSDFSVGYLRCLQICSTFTHTFIVRWLLTVSSNLLLLFTNRWFRWNGFYSFLSVVNYIISRIWNKSWKNVSPGVQHCEAAGRAHAAYEVTWIARPHPQRLQGMVEFHRYIVC